MSIETADAFMSIFGFKRVTPIPKKAKKPKLTPLPSLIRKADALTSLYIRQKYARDDGTVQCVTCGKVLHWKDSHCAHFIGRSAKATRWLEENLHPACPSCNVFRKEFHMREYTLFMEDFYGREFVDELRALEKKVCHSSEVRQMAEEAIEYYGKGIV